VRAAVAVYEFLSTWCFDDVSLPDAFELLRNSEQYPRWWKGVKSAEITRRGDADGIGDTIAFAWRSVLPYTLRFELELTRVEPPHLIEASARGELEGTGTWRLYEGQGVAIVYEWRVATTKRWMNLFGPLARPAFVWNHDLVMRQGARGLAEQLRAPLVVCD
jgi:uncharacterized protein YndB with AHSA1/START domain